MVAPVVRTVASLVIPLAAVPSQELATALDGQACQIAIYMRGDGLFLDLSVDGIAIVAGVACLDRVPMVQAAYTGFVGELLFFDTQGLSDPTYDGLGSRFLLVWLGA